MLAYLNILINVPVYTWIEDHKIVTDHISISDAFNNILTSARNQTHQVRASKGPDHIKTLTVP